MREAPKFPSVSFPSDRIEMALGRPREQAVLMVSSGLDDALSENVVGCVVLG